MGHTLRGAVGAWLALIVLETVVKNGNGRVASAFTDVNTLLQRAFDPGVPAIADRRTTTPAQVGAAAASVAAWTPATVPSGSAIPGAHPGAQVNPSTGQVVGFGY